MSAHIARAPYGNCNQWIADAIDKRPVALLFRSCGCAEVAGVAMSAVCIFSMISTRWLGFNSSTVGLAAFTFD